ncbi:hypothetical protein DFLDMN_006429 (plasmid) [Cupriavidus sp. H19C3]|jgi:hypothetical protein|uniref:hypothetical protein n=1 Tax=Cupriavidus sp. H19C3 TaxID=3241603 RepID=UPI003BF83AF9
MKKTLLFAGLLSAAATAMAANVGAVSMHLSIDTPSGKQEALVSTLAPSVTSNGRTISYARSCKVDGSGKPSIERATIFEGTTVTVHPKQINDGTRVIADVVAVDTRLRKMDKVEQGGCYIELPDVDSASAESHFNLASGKSESMSLSGSNGASLKVTVQLP